jgi:hypothetical protein
MEAPVRPMFGQITLEDMRRNELLTRTVLPLVRAACEHSRGRFTHDNIAAGLIDGAYHLWGVMRPPASLEGVAVTHKQNKVLEILALGPHLDEIVPFLPHLTGVARDQGCERICMTGPNFLRRRLPEGWRPAAVLYERMLVDAEPR